MGLFKSSWEREVGDNLFDYIEIDYFRNYKASTIFQYILMLALLTLHIALYVLDVYTCVKLLAFNEWSSQVKPYLSFKVSKWLFAACIICSVVLLIHDAVQGIRVYRTRNISLTYTNNFAKVARSLRYKYHCVLNEINPSSGFDKMAFYTYFTLANSMKLILADSPRQVINALTLYSVFDIEAGVSGFWNTLKTVSTQNRSEALILYSMFVSFVIWIFFMCELFFALVFLIPVYHKIKQNGFKYMKQYVCVKVDETVKKLAKKFAKKRLLKEHRKRNANEKLGVDEKPSIPTIPSVPTFSSSDQSIPKIKTMESISTFSSENSSNTMVDANPFRNIPQRKAPINNYGSQSNLSSYNSSSNLKSYASESTLASSYALPQKPTVLHHKDSSQSSLLTRYQETPPQQSIYGTPSLSGSTRSFRNFQDPSSQFGGVLTPISSHSDYASVHRGTPVDLNSQNPVYPPRDIFIDEEKHIGTTHVAMSSASSFSQDDEFDEFDKEDELDEDPEIQYSPPQQDADYDSLLDDDTTISRVNVRESLYRRARDMELEDYVNLRPQEPQSYLPGPKR